MVATIKNYIKVSQLVYFSDGLSCFNKWIQLLEVPTPIFFYIIIKNNENIENIWKI